MTKPSLLIVDDEKEVLNALHRVLRKEFELHLFSDPIKALEFYKNNPVPLVISDMRMPEMDGATFLTNICQENIQSKRFLLTGHADIDLTVAAVNDGNITHYFAKPWNNDELVAELKSAYEIYLSERKTKVLLKKNIQKNAELSLLNSSLELEINKTQKKLLLISSKGAKNFTRLKKTFSTFVEIYAESIALHNQETTRHNFRVASHARLLAEQLGEDKLSVFQIYIAGLLYEAGKLSIPQSILQQPVESLIHQDKTLYNTFYDAGAVFLSKIDELSFVANIVRHIPEYFNGAGKPENLAEDNIPLGSRILSVVVLFDNLILGRHSSLALSVIESKERVRELSGKVFDPNIVTLYFQMLEHRTKPVEGIIEYQVNLSELSIGDVLTQNIVNELGNSLLTKGTVIEQQHIDKLSEISKEQQLNFTLFVTAHA
ncbi:MAG: response regulator [Colwellia sp.]|nr:response regulator [Colwellia sp.]